MVNIANTILFHCDTVCPCSLEDRVSQGPPDGHHLTLMQYLDRVFLYWQAHYLPKDMKHMEVSSWM